MKYLRPSISKYSRVSLAVLWMVLVLTGLVTAGAITDHSGRTITFEAPFVRLISLYGAHTENLVMLGHANAIIGISSSDRSLDQVKSRPVYSYHDDPERFIAARPDLVLIRPMIERAYPALIEKLEKNRIVVVSLQPGSVAEMFAYWEVLGKLTGRNRQARQMVADFSRAIDRFGAVTKQVQPKKKVYFEAIHSRMKTFTPDSMAAYVLQTAGGINIAADALQVRTTNIAYYGKERLIGKAAEIDVYLAQVGAMNQTTVAAIKTEPGYRVIKAVKNDDVYLIDEQIVSRPTMRLLCGIAQTGQILYPEVFTEPSRDILNSIARVKCQ